MSTPNKQLIAAIQRIAEGSPLFTEVRGLLKEIQRRGGIEGLSLKIGADDESGGDCCTDPNETGEPTDSTAPDISGDAPPDMSGGTPEGWTDCETGDAIQFTPAGFAQAETCKECEPDETWEQGKYWRAVTAVYGDFRAATMTAAFAGMWSQIENYGGSSYPELLSGPTRVDDNSYIGTWRFCDSRQCYQNRTYYINRYVCGPSAADYCQLTEAPETCGDNWTPDSTTNYTLANGCITGSSCDPDATEQAKQCNEQIKICDENGNERIIESIGNGQFIMYDESGTHKGGRYNAATGERLEVLDPGSNGGYGSIE